MRETGKQRAGDRDAGLRVLTGAGVPLDTTGPDGPLILGVFAAFADFEHESRSEQTRKGMQAIQRHGKHIGRPMKLTPEQVA